MVDAAIFATKLLHLLAAFLWLGITAFLVLLEAPHVAKMQGMSRLRRFHNTERRAFPWLAAASGSTILFGWELARQLYGTANPVAWTETAAGQAAAYGASLALIAFILGILHRPFRARLAAACSDEPGPHAQDEGESARRALLGLQITILGLLVLTLALMVGANLGGF